MYVYIHIYMSLSLYVYMHIYLYIYMCICHVTHSVPCHMAINHVTYVWIMSMKASCHTHTTQTTSNTQRVMSHMNESYRIWMSHVAYEWVMSHTHILQTTSNTQRVMSHMNEPWRIWMSHVTHAHTTNHQKHTTSHVTHKSITSHILCSNESCHT